MLPITTNSIPAVELKGPDFSAVLWYLLPLKGFLVLVKVIKVHVRAMADSKG